jgi:predicted deacylase
MNNVQIIETKEDLNISSLEPGKTHRFHVQLSDNSLGTPWRVPLIVVKGTKEGPNMGITSALHGNELNGIPTIFKLINQINPTKLSVTLILSPISNVPGYLMNQRHFEDNIDLNRIMPGKLGNNSSHLYAHYFIEKIVKKFDYLLDLHTASHGRVNSLYIRADIEHEETRSLAYLQNPQIIVQKYDEKGTLRAWATENNIPAITIEIGNPNTFQHDLIDESLEGILNTLRYLKMIDGEVKDMLTDATVCEHSYWIYTQKGGIVDILPNLTDSVKNKEVIAIVYDVFGNVREKIKANKAGIVIGKSIRPDCSAGTRILHLGVQIFDPESVDIPGHEDFEQ